MIEADIAVVGGGIAGATAAACLAAERRVVLLEREEAPGYHSSGRSAALFSETYGGPVVRALASASRPFLENPPAGFAEYPLLAPRGALFVGGADDRAKLAAMLEAGRALVPSVRPVSTAEARALVPALRPEAIAGGVFEPDARDLDTNGLLQGQLRLFRARGGIVLTRAGVEALERGGPGWRIETRAGPVAAALVVNAAGAWADTLATMAGLGSLGLRPLRRTAFLFEPPAGLETRGWPMVIAAREDWYIKPDAGMLLGSPADETPSEPADAQAEEIDIAVAVDRIEAYADLPVRRIARRWAGLRTFARDRVPACGPDPRDATFVWLAGQGGYGIKTSPALGALLAGLVLRGEVPDALAARGLTREALAPERLLAA